MHNNPKKGISIRMSCRKLKNQASTCNLPIISLKMETFSKLYFISVSQNQPPFIPEQSSELETKKKV